MVNVSEGTLGRGHDSLVTRAIQAFTGRGRQIVVSRLHGTEALPADALAPQWVSHDQLFPRTDFFITNGGYGGVLAALGHGCRC